MWRSVESLSDLRKPLRHREWAYLRWIRELSCCRCYSKPCEVHHVVRRGNDRLVVPCCRECHLLFHRRKKYYRNQLLEQSGGYWRLWLKKS